jgi:hypothetical protein
LLAHCESVGRDPAEIEISAQVFPQDGGHPAALEIASGLARSGAGHIVLIMPADLGADGLRMLAREVAEPLRERFG